MDSPPAGDDGDASDGRRSSDFLESPASAAAAPPLTLAFGGPATGSLVARIFAAAPSPPSAASTPPAAAGARHVTTTANLGSSPGSASGSPQSAFQGKGRAAAGGAVGGGGGGDDANAFARMRDALGLIRAYDADVQQMLRTGSARGLFQNLAPARLHSVLEFLHRAQRLRADLVDVVSGLVHVVVSKFLAGGVPLAESDPEIRCLVDLLDFTFRYGVRAKRSLFAKARTFWDCVVEQLDLASAGLATVNNMAVSPPAKVRCWIQVGLMDKSLASQIVAVISNETLMSENYEPYAVTLSEQMTIIAGLLASLESVDFNLFLSERDLERDASALLTAPHRADLGVATSTAQPDDPAATFLPLTFERFVTLHKRLVQDALDAIKPPDADLPEAADRASSATGDGVAREQADEGGRSKSRGEEAAASGQDHAAAIVVLLNQKRYLEDEMKSLQERFEKSRLAITELTRLEEGSARQLSALKRETEAKSSRIANLEGHVRKLAEQNSALRIDREAHQRRREQAIHRGTQTEDSYDLAQFESLQEHAASLSAEACRLRKLNRGLLADLSSAREAAAARQGEVAALREEQERARAREEASAGELAVFRQRQADRESRELYVERELERLREQLRATRARSAEELEGARAELSRARDEGSSLRSSLRSSDDLVAEVRSRAADAEEARARLEENLSRLERDLCDKEERQRCTEEELRAARRLVDQATQMRDLLRGARWADDRLVSECSQCRCKFTLVNRKHHCRSCGRVFCTACTRRRMVLSSSWRPARVCDGCYAALGGGEGANGVPPGSLPRLRSVLSLESLLFDGAGGEVASAGGPDDAPLFHGT